MSVAQDLRFLRLTSLRPRRHVHLDFDMTRFSRATLWTEQVVLDLAAHHLTIGELMVMSLINSYGKRSSDQEDCWRKWTEGQYNMVSCCLLDTPVPSQKQLYFMAKKLDQDCFLESFRYRHAMRIPGVGFTWKVSVEYWLVIQFQDDTHWHSRTFDLSPTTTFIEYEMRRSSRGNTKALWSERHQPLHHQIQPCTFEPPLQLGRMTRLCDGEFNWCSTSSIRLFLKHKFSSFMANITSNLRLQLVGSQDIYGGFLLLSARNLSPVLDPHLVPPQIVGGPRFPSCVLLAPRFVGMHIESDSCQQYTMKSFDYLDLCHSLCIDEDDIQQNTHFPWNDHACKISLQKYLKYLEVHAWWRRPM